MGIHRTHFTSAGFQSANAGAYPGPDLEWFAVDADGRVGGFTNAGFGPVPRAVFDDFADFNRVLDVANSLPRVGGATWMEKKPRVFDTWQTWAESGIFAFDWNHKVAGHDSSLPYRLLCAPAPRPSHQNHNYNSKATCVVKRQFFFDVATPTNHGVSRCAIAVPSRGPFGRATGPANEIALRGRLLGPIFP